MTASQLLCLIDLLGSCALSAGWLLYHGWGDRGRPAISAARAMVVIGLALFGTAFAVVVAIDAPVDGSFPDYLGDPSMLCSCYLGIGAGAMLAGLILGDHARRSQPLQAAAGGHRADGSVTGCGAAARTDVNVVAGIRRRATTT